MLKLLPIGGQKNLTKSIKQKILHRFCIIIFCSARILCGLFWRCWQQQLLHSAVLILLHNHHGFTSHHLNLPRAQARWMIRRYFSLIVYFITVILFTFFPLSPKLQQHKGFIFLNMKASFDLSHVAPFKTMISCQTRKQFPLRFLLFQKWW